MSDEQFVPFTMEQLMNGEYPKDRPIHIYCEGIYDLFHFGHCNQLRQVKTAFPNAKVTAGVCRDDEAMHYKDGPLVMNLEERCRVVRECKYVDVVRTDGPYWPTIEFLNDIKADLIAHDDVPCACPSSSDYFTEFKKVDRFLPTQRTDDVSTTELIQRVVDRYEEFKKYIVNEKRPARG